jgi:hypothetical protein
MSALSRAAIRTNLQTLVANVGSAQVAVRHALGGGPKPLQILLITNEDTYTSDQQFAPMDRHAAALRRHFGAVLKRKSVAQGIALSRSALASVDLLGIKLSFLTPAAEAQRVVDHFRSVLAGTPTKLVYFDGDDDVCIQWPGVLKAVDLYVKKHVFSDFQDYGRHFLGKSNLTDFVSRGGGQSFENNVITASGPIDQADLSKLHLGWNIALDDKIAKQASDIPRGDADRMDIDIASRAYVKPEVWTYPLRAPVVEKLEVIADRFRVLAPRDRVSQEQYYSEMLRARICVSPYGYGELCWRDFEAVLCGCLLVKPNMDHVHTWPNIFVAGETYAPVKWDYSDLEAVCARYLADEPARRRIADRAHEVLISALEEKSFVSAFEAMLKRLGLPAAA